MVMALAAARLDLHSRLDNDMFNHIAYVSNRILMIAKTEGVSKDTLEVMGKYLWRLLRVLQAYNAKKNRETSWREVARVIADFKSVFGG